MIETKLAEMDEPKVKEKLVARLAQIKEGKRDLYF